MKRLKALTVVIFVIGVLCFVFSLLMISTLERTVLIWEMMQDEGVEGASASSLRAGLITVAIAYAVIGLGSMVSAVGLFLRREWARKLWLGVLFLLVASSLHFIVTDYHRGLLFRTENLIGYPIVATFIGGMWFYFTQQKTRDLFRRTTRSNEPPIINLEMMRNSE